MKEKIYVASSAIGGMVLYYLGGKDLLLTSLFVLMVLDYVTGILSAVATKTLSSRIGLEGIVRKTLLLSIVAVAFIIQSVLGDTFPLREAVLLFFIANEGISILENAARVGLPLPRTLKEVLSQLQEDDSSQ